MTPSPLSQLKLTTLFLLLTLLFTLALSAPLDRQLHPNNNAGTPPDLVLTLTNPFAAKATAPAPASSTVAPTAQKCVCSVVFGDKSSVTVNTVANSQNGITGQASGAKKLACTAQLLVVTGCAGATANESDNNCVKSQACTTA